MPRKPKTQKQPAKRPSRPAKARKRSTKGEHADHVNYATRRLMVCRFPYEVTKGLVRNFGLGERQAQKVITEARSQIRAAVEELMGDQMPAALATYLWVIDRGARAGKLDAVTRAQSRIDRLLGLDKSALDDAADAAAVLELVRTLQQPPPPDIEDEDDAPPP